LQVDDESHVRLVDAHAERVGRHYDPALVGQEGLQDTRTLAATHASVIHLAAVTSPRQTVADVFHRASRGRVHDGRATVPP
jgi:hypothetical protein